MRCPYCGARESKVVDSRETETTIRRRRECETCAQRFTTYERIESASLRVIKRDGRREDFDRAKLLAGLVKASTKRPVAIESLEALVDSIETDLSGSGRAEVNSSQIGDLAMAGLRELDEIAYMRFASVYRAFPGLDEFSEEISEFKAWKARKAESRNQLSLSL